jgi:excisionase family DNA binding protein
MTSKTTEATAGLPGYEVRSTTTREQLARAQLCSVRPAKAAEMLGVCRDTVYELMRSGRLRSVKVGRARLIPLAAIGQFLADEGDPDDLGGAA